MINKAILIGRLGQDPEVRYTQEGTNVTSFSIALDESYKSKTGEKVQKTVWINISAWGKLGEICAEYLRKGSQVYIEGKIDIKDYTDKKGETKKSFGVIANTMKMLGGKSDNQHSSHDSTGAASPYGPLPEDIPSSDVPF